MFQSQADFVCDYCNRSFTRKYNLQSHIENYHLNSSCCCEICEQRFGSPAGLQQHLSRGHNRYGQAYPECDICGRVFTRKQNVTSHMITVHLQGARSEIRCTVCDKTFTTIRNLKRHTNQIHNPYTKHPTCDECKRVFKGKQSLITHILSTHQVTKRGMIKCQLCDKVYTNNRNLKRHVEMFHGERGEFKCDSCPKVYTSNQSLKRHTRTRHSLKNIQYNCPKCYKTVFGTDDINRHVTYCHGYDLTNVYNNTDFNLKNICTKCNKSFNEEPLLRRHIKTEHSFQDFYNYCRRSLLKLVKTTNQKRQFINCEFCKNAFVNVHELKDHMRVNHDKEYSLSSCNVCFNKFYSKETMLEHRKICFPPPNANSCSYCNKLFTDISSLEFHTRIFHPQTQINDSVLSDEALDLGCYKCTHCNRVYYSDRSLKHHIKLKHTAEKTVECQFCGKVCSNKYYLASHIKIVHTATAWSKCHYCDKQFKSKRNIRRHIEYTHLGMQRYKCIECATLFKEKRSLRKHVRIKHPNSSLFPECHICHKRFESAKSCKIHLKLLHSFNMNTHPCDLCSVSFNSMEALNIHLQMSHLAEDEIYKCEECNLVFKGHEKFDLHNQATHCNVVLNVKRKSLPRCVICVKDFSSRKTLKRHIKKFHEELDVEELANYGWLVNVTNVECEECIKSLSDDVKYNLYKNMKHLRESIVFQCKMCLSSYNALEYAVLRYKVVNACKSKMILSEFCTAEMSDCDSHLAYDGSELVKQENTAAEIKLEVTEELLFQIKTEPMSPEEYQ
ncbi:zinc finger protein 600-like [Battus philenor]|uniref:zinc finger protein 600-like n=1 Tax=Battus philenor TaxID=42288 RepID=UPI0035CF5C04